MTARTDFTPPDTGALARFLHTAVFAAIEAGRIQQAQRGAELRVSTKSSDVDLVTQVDRLCEQRIREVLATAYPTHAVLGEESGASEGSDSRYRWIVDPLDGTVNYAHGFPHYNVSIALEVDGVVRVGAVFDVGRDELFTATSGGGAFLNGKPIRVTTTSEVRRALVCTGFSYDTGERLENLELFSRVLTQVQGVRRPGAAALDLCYVACGRLDVFWELALKPWDAAAALLVLQEAGGAATGGSGEAYRLGDNLLVATNGHVHAKFLAVLGANDLRA